MNLKETLRLDNWKKATVCEIEGNCKIGNWKEVIHFWDPIHEVNYEGAKMTMYTDFMTVCS